MRRQQSRTAMVVALTVLGLAPTAGAARKHEDVCRATAKAAFTACKAAASATRQIASAKCLNTPDASAKKACSRQAASDARDAIETCDQGRTARNAACATLGPTPYHPTIDPANFVAAVTNAYFPLTPGKTFHYESHPSPQVTNEDDFVVTANTKTILGVPCVEVHDTVKTNGELVEDTLDWFAQDKDGNVWYFGENTEELAGGRPTTLEGTFEAGTNGAQPGIVMEAAPKVGDFYRQEFDVQNAEDWAEVVGLDETITAGGVTYTHCLKTKETTPLEPDVVENKFYAPNVGNVATIDMSTGEREELLSVTP
jgi:hypothetical protein